jgi:Flp pilus assembly protein TadD
MNRSDVPNLFARSRSAIKRRFRRVLTVLVVRAARRTMERGDWNAACLLLRLGLSLWKHPLLFARLGTSAFRLGRYALAVRSLRSATAVSNPRSAHEVALGVLYRTLGYRREARSLITTALAHKSDSPAALMELGKLCHLERQYDDAVCLLEQSALTAFGAKRAALAWVALAELHKDRADRKATVSCAIHAAAADPQCVHAYRLLSEVDFYDSAIHPHISQMERLVRKRRLPRDDRAILHFALGRLHDRQSRWDAAFRNMALGNSLRRAMFRGALKHGRRKEDVRRYVRTFTRERVSALSQFGAGSDALIFVVGMPRSGTTLLEQMLDCHPAVKGLGERTDIFDVATYLPKRLWWTNIAYPECVELLPGEAVSEMSQALVKDILKHADGARRVVTKRPDDSFELGLVHILFPGARIIHCTRDPLDTCLSCYMQDFADIPYANTLTDIRRHYDAYLAIMEHWRCVLPSNLLLEVRYENVVRSPEAEIDAILRFCGLEPDERCAAFSSNSRPIHTASAWQVWRPLYSAAIGRAAHYERHLGPLRTLCAPSRGSPADSDKGGDRTADDVGRSMAAIVPSYCEHARRGDAADTATVIDGHTILTGEK